MLLHVRAVACGSLFFTVPSDGSCNSGCSNLGLCLFSDSSKISHLCLFGMKENLPVLLSDCAGEGALLFVLQDTLSTHGCWELWALGLQQPWGVA